MAACKSPKYRLTANCGSNGFTLVELLVAISLSVIILGAVYFSLNSALESWRYTTDELALQHVTSGLLEDIIEGNDWNPGLRAALEISEAEQTRVAFVLPWSEEQPVTRERLSFQLSQFVKLGTGLPIAELRLSETKVFSPIPVTWADVGSRTERPRLKPEFELVPGSTIRFSYHPDAQRVPEAVEILSWAPQEQALLLERAGNREQLGKNPFGVVISECRFRYYDQMNNPLVVNGDVRREDLPLVAAIEVQLTGRLGSHTLTLLGIATLRNSMRHSGVVTLREGLQVPIPDSRVIHTFMLTNLIGIKHGDELQLEIQPSLGRTWRLSMRFERFGQSQPVIASVTAEYPPGHPLFTERPRTGVDIGLDLLTLGPGGLYDYDDDPDVEDVVLVEDKPILLTVTKMDVQGAACYVRP